MDVIEVITSMVQWNRIETPKASMGLGSEERGLRRGCPHPHWGWGMGMGLCPLPRNFFEVFVWK